MNPLLCGLLALSVAAVSALLIRQYGLIKGVRSDPDRLRYYSERRPMFGGLAVALGFWAGLALFLIWTGGRFGDVYYSDSTALGMTTALWWATVFLVLPTSLSDRRQDTGYYDWLYVLASAAFIASNHFTINEVAVPFFGVLVLPLWAGILVTVLWIALVVAVVEVLESVGSLVTLIPVLLISLYFYFSVPDGEVVQRVTAVCFIGSVVGLMPIQHIRDGIVVGKAGNKVVGFLFAALTLVGRHKATTTEFFILPIGIIIFYIVVHNLVRFEKPIQAEE